MEIISSQLPLSAILRSPGEPDGLMELPFGFGLAHYITNLPAQAWYGRVGLLSR
jgi:hypothetical protein